MPIYEYRCTACGSEWEEVQKITDSPVEVCPECREPQAHRLISRTSFMLRGTGWYVTDYGRGSGGRAGEKSSPAKKDSTKDSSTTSTPKSD
jgi:putative FmdB family regulatory protein